MSRKSAEVLQRPCYHISKQKDPYESSQAIVYLKLRDDGCFKKSAIDFCKTRHCRIDVSSCNAGPRKFRILKNKATQRQKMNTQGGWLYNIYPEYNMGKQFVMHTDDILLSDKQDEDFVKHLEKCKNQVKNDYKNREKILNEYLKELEQKYNFSQLNDAQLKKTLQKLKAQSALEKTKEKIYMQHKHDEDQPELFEIVEFVKDRPNPFNLGLYPELIDPELINKYEFKQKRPERDSTDYSPTPQTRSNKNRLTIFNFSNISTSDMYFSDQKPKIGLQTNEELKEMRQHYNQAQYLVTDDMHKKGSPEKEAKKNLRKSMFFSINNSPSMKAKNKLDSVSGSPSQKQQINNNNEKETFSQEYMKQARMITNNGGNQNNEAYIKQETGQQESDEILQSQSNMNQIQIQEGGQNNEITDKRVQEHDNDDNSCTNIKTQIGVHKKSKSQQINQKNQKINTKYQIFVDAQYKMNSVQNSNRKSNQLVKNKTQLQNYSQSSALQQDSTKSSILQQHLQIDQQVEPEISETSMTPQTIKKAQFNQTLYNFQIDQLNSFANTIQNKSNTVIDNGKLNSIADKLEKERKKFEKRCYSQQQLRSLQLNNQNNFFKPNITLKKGFLPSMKQSQSTGFSYGVQQ